jgi:hypothetical protein
MKHLEENAGRWLPAWMAAVVTAIILFTGDAPGRASPRPPSPRAGSCSETCNRKASECLDACDSKFKEDKPRVECKVQCSADRQKCESGCSP